MDAYKGKAVPRLGDTSRYELMTGYFERLGCRTDIRIFGALTDTQFVFQSMIEGQNLFQHFYLCGHDVEDYWHVLAGILSRQSWEEVAMDDEEDCSRLWVKRFCKHQVSEAVCAAEEFIDKLGSGHFEMKLNRNEDSPNKPVV